MRRELRIDIIRIIAIVMIFCFHYCCVLGLTDSHLYGYANGGWGCVGTTIFYIVSGYSLQLRYKRFDADNKISSFYKKRFFAIFPSIWIIFIVGYLVNALGGAGYRYGGSPLKIIFSILGIDGYLSFLGKQTYYVTGEWYTAVILAIYVVYPIICYIFQKFRFTGLILITLIYGLNIALWSDKVSPDASFITGILMFYIGMIICEYRDILGKCWWLIFAYITIALVIYKIELPYYKHTLPYKNLLGIVVFLIVFVLVTLIDKTGKSSTFNKVISYLASITFEVYLIHHYVLIKMQARYNVNVSDSNAKIKLLVISAFITLVLAMVVNYCVKKFIKVFANKG